MPRCLKNVMWYCIAVYTLYTHPNPPYLFTSDPWTTLSYIAYTQNKKGANKVPDGPNGCHICGLAPQKTNLRCREWIEVPVLGKLSVWGSMRDARGRASAINGRLYRTLVSVSQTWKCHCTTILKFCCWAISPTILKCYCTATNNWPTRHSCR